MGQRGNGEEGRSLEHSPHNHGELYWALSSYLFHHSQDRDLDLVTLSEGTG